MMEGFGFDPYSAAQWGMTGAQQPDLMAQVLGSFGFPPPGQGGMSMFGGPGVGQALGGSMPGGLAPPSSGGEATANPAAPGLAALGRAFQASKQGSTDIKPQFSGGITQAGKADGPPGMKGGQSSQLSALMQTLLGSKGGITPIPQLGALLGGR